MYERQHGAVGTLRKRDGDDRIRVFVAEFGRAPGLNDALGGDQIEIATADLAVPGRHFGADHFRRAAGHL
jgi:hypothetical protein